MNQQIADFVQAVQTAFDTVNTNLDNIVADEANLLAEIQAFKDRGDSLSPEAQAALDSLVTNAQSLVSRTKSAADSVPDAPAPPAG